MIDYSVIEEKLFSFLPKDLELEKNLIDSMSYSLMAGGKRVRPALVLEFAEACGGNSDKAMPAAAAVEYIHTYSLIHDDLPCMDDDDFRRGKPSNHKVYGEDISLLAGDALQSLAFKTLSLPSFVNDVGAKNAIRCVNILSVYCGAEGMVGGQVIDIEHENKNAGIEIISEMDRKKTGALIKSACEMGCVCGGGSEKQISAARKYGECIGLAFQVMDDILDVTSTGETLGKPVGSDLENNKSTYVSLLGIEKCREIVKEQTQQAIEALKAFDSDTTALKELALKLSDREK